MENQTEFNVTGKTGSTTLTVEQIPSHKHSFSAYTGSSQWAIGYLWGRAAGDGGNKPGAQGGTEVSATGGGKGHTHSLNSHTHTVPYIEVYVWQRTA